MIVVSPDGFPSNFTRICVVPQNVRIALREYFQSTSVSDVLCIKKDKKRCEKKITRKN